MIYKASPDELDGLATNVLLGTLRKGEATTLTVELTVPIELGNEYASRVGEVDWIFTVEALDDPEPMPTPTPETAEEPDEPDDEPVTPAPTPGMGGSPGTGDHLHFGRYIVLMLLSIVVLLVVKNRISKRDKE